MDKLFRWTIYLMIFFAIAVSIYVYFWWSFEPKKIELAYYYRKKSLLTLIDS